MKLYVMRHGETKTNTMDIIIGNKETELTENGKKQAQKAKKYINQKQIDYVYSSPLKRAKITANIVSDKQAIIEKELIERVKKLITKLVKKHPSQNILLVTHSAVARAIHYSIIGIPKDGDLTKLEIPNC